MKKFILLSLFCAIAVSVFGQYRKLLMDEGHYWRIWQKNINISVTTCCFTMRVMGDYTYNGIVYKNLYAYDFVCDREGFSPNEGGFLREDTLRRIVVALTSSTEKILFNFSKNVGDTALMMNATGSTTSYTLISKDSLLMFDGQYYRRFNYSGNYSIIEGLGSTRGILKPWPNIFENSYSLVEFYKDGIPKQTIYSSNITCPSPPIDGLPVQNTFPSDFRIYPNPVASKLNIKIPEFAPTSDFHIIITNNLGQVIGEVELLEASTNISTSELAAGIYQICLKSNQGIVTKKFVKVE